MRVRSLSFRFLLPFIAATLTVSLLAPVVLAVSDAGGGAGDVLLLKEEKNGDDSNGESSTNGEANPLNEMGGIGMAPRGTRVGSPNTMTNNLFISAPQALPGQVVQVSGNVCNSGSGSGTRTAVFYVNGHAEQSQTVGVSPGACQTVVFYFARAVPGQYQVAIDGSIGYVNVVAPRWVTGTTPATEEGLGTAGIVCIIVVLGALIIAIVYIERIRAGKA